MFGDDDRVITLLKQIGMEDRLIKYDFDENFDYLKDIDYSNYDILLPKLQKKANKFLEENVVKYYNENSSKKSSI